MGIIDKDGHIKQPSQFWDLGPIAIAAIFTLCIFGLWFFSFKVPTDKPASEVMMGIGQASAIHQPAAPKPPNRP